jgi:hypothetical protein
LAGDLSDQPDQDEHFGAVAKALNRQLGTSYQSYRTAWLMHQKLIRTIALKDDEQPLSVSVQLDDAYLRRRTPGGVGCGSTNPSGHPMRAGSMPSSALSRKP